MQKRIREIVGFDVSRNIGYLFFIMFLAACSGDCGSSCACGGFEDRPFPPEFYPETIVNSGQVRVTPTGFDFIEQNLPSIVEGALPGGLSFCVPEMTGSFEACYGSTCSTGETGCDMTLTIDDAEITTMPQDTILAKVTIGDLNDELTVKLLGGNCVATLKSESGNATGAQIPATLPVIFSVEAASPTKDVRITLGDLDVDLRDIDIDLKAAPGGNFGDTLACGAVNVVAGIGLIKTILFAILEPFLSDAIDGLSQEALCQSCATEACPGGSSCNGDDICVYPNDECVPIPLGMEGRFLLGNLLSDFSEHPESAMDLMIKVADTATVNDGLTLGARSGFQPDKIEECVPVDPGKRPNFAPIPLSNAIVGNTKPNGQPFMFGLGYHKKAIQQLMWSTWASGATCLRVSSDSLGDSFNLSAGTLGALIPSVKDLYGKNAGVFIKIVPQTPPDVILGQNMVTPMGTTYTVDDPLMTIDWKDLDIHIYFFAQDQWTRVFTLRGDINIPLALVPDGMGQIVPVMGDLGDALTNLRIWEAGMVAEEEHARILTLIPTLIAAALPALAGSISDPIALPDLFGLEFVFEEGDITSVDAGNMLAIYASLAVSTTPLVASIHPAIASTTVNMGQFSNGMVKPSVDLELFSITDVPTDVVEYQYRVGDSWWSMWDSNTNPHIDDARLVIPGIHKIQVRARVRGIPETTTDAMETSVLIDWDAPAVEMVQTKEAIVAEAQDLVAKADQLSYRFRLVGEGLSGDWTTWSPSAQIAIPALVPELLRVDVEVSDQAGNVGSRTQMFKTAAGLTETESAPATGGQPETGDMGGCNNTGSGPGSLLGLLLLGGVLMLRRRRKLNPIVLGFVGLLAVSGCSCEDEATGGDCDCPSNTYCNDAKECVPGCETDDNCVTGQKCEANQCVEDCDQICAGSCTGEEFGQCTDGECACIPYCEAGCGDDTYCCYASNTCEALPNECADQVCEPGFEPAVAMASTADEATCETVTGTCECVALPPLPLGWVGQYLDIATNGTIRAAAAYNTTYADLMVGIVNSSGSVDWEFVDGVPADGSITGGLEGPRGGISTKGDKVGTHTSIEVDSAGVLHVFYRDETNNTFKYARGTEAASGHTWEFATLDDTPNTGLWSDVVLMGDELHLVYTTDQIGTAAPLTSELRYTTILTTTAVASVALAPTTLGTSGASNPCGEDACSGSELCFASDGTCRVPDSNCNACPTGSSCRNGSCAVTFDEGASRDFARMIGVGNELSATPDGLLVVFYDGNQQSMGWAQMTAGTWGMPNVVGTPSGPFGSGFVDANGDLHLTYMDTTGRPTLVYEDTAGNTETIADGIHDFPGQWYISPVGQNASLRVDAAGVVSVSYQDASTHTLTLATRDASGMWTSAVLGEPSAPYTGAHGFYAKMLQVPDEAWVASFVIDQSQDPSEGNVESH